MPTQDGQSRFLRLPAEIRLQIYSLLVLPRQSTDLLPRSKKVFSSTELSFDYDKMQFGTDRPSTTDLSSPTLLIRTLKPTVYSSLRPKTQAMHLRSAYTVRSEMFRARCMQTTYHCVNTPGIQENLAILRTNQQIHAEVAELLYGSYVFDFDTHVEAIVPFLSDLTPFARSCIKSIRIVKRALASDKEFDRAEWSTAFSYLTSSSAGIALRCLDLGVMAGRPGEDGWANTARYSAQDFGILKDTDGMEWIQCLLEMHGLQQLEVSAVIEHCAPARNSNAMARFIQFSASVDTGFRDFLRGRLLAAPA